MDAAKKKDYVRLQICLQEFSCKNFETVFPASFLQPAPSPGTPSGGSCSKAGIFAPAPSFVNKFVTFDEFLL